MTLHSVRNGLKRARRLISALLNLLYFTLLAILFPLSAKEQEPDRLLDEADRLAWLNNWDMGGRSRRPATSTGTATRT